MHLKVNVTWRQQQAKQVITPVSISACMVFIYNELYSPDSAQMIYAQQTAFSKAKESYEHQ